MDTMLRRRAMMVSGVEPPEPPEFYDYLYFDGTAHIQTNIFIPADGSIRVPLGKETVKAQQGLFAEKNSNNAAITAVFYNSSTTSTARHFGIRYRNTSSSSANNLNFSNNTFNFFLTPKKYGWGTTAYSVTKGSATPASGLDFGFLSGSQSYTGRMGVIEIYGSDAQDVATFSGFETYTPIYTLKPCKYNGQDGLWCVETSTFYGNTAGSGTLTASNS